MMLLREIAWRTEDGLKSRMTLAQRRRLAMLRLRGRLLTAQWRALPDALIIGGQRCGTSSLYKYLDRHPGCAASLRKEVGYFTSHYHRGELWYRAHFGISRAAPPAKRSESPRRVAFEATPDYLFDPRAAERAVRLLPHARIIVLLRDPVERAISHYEHSRRLGLDRTSFEQAITTEESRVGPGLERIRNDPDLPLPPEVRHFSYLTRGHYADQLRPWLVRFPRDAVLVLRSEDLFAQPAALFDRVLSFLDLPPWHPPTFDNFSYAGARRPEKDRVSPGMREQLARYFEARNRDLHDLLGRDMQWQAPPVERGAPVTASAP